MNPSIACLDSIRAHPAFPWAAGIPVAGGGLPGCRNGFSRRTAGWSILSAPWRRKDRVRPPRMPFPLRHGMRLDGSVAPPEGCVDVPCRHDRPCRRWRPGSRRASPRALPGRWMGSTCGKPAGCPALTPYRVFTDRKQAAHNSLRMNDPGSIPFAPVRPRPFGLNETCGKPAGRVSRPRNAFRVRGKRY